jgi:hypothetical protein
MKILFFPSYYLFKDMRFGGSKKLYCLARELQNYVGRQPVSILRGEP